MNKSIGSILRQARKDADISVNDVVLYLEENGINTAAKTIYGWENDSARPSINTFLLLCKKYGIKDILKTFGYDK